MIPWMFITSGPVPPNPAELLLSNRLDMLMEELRREYDFILIDTVPYGVVADAQVINRIADLCIYVIREGRFDRRLCRMSRNFIRMADCHIWLLF